MIKGGLFIISQVATIIAFILNFSVLITYFLRPLKMNSSRYFIPISTVQNIIYSLCGGLLTPRSSTWNFCWTFVVTGVVSDSWALGQCFLQMLFIVLLLNALTIANNFFNSYLLICRNKYVFFYLSPRGLITLFAVNAFIIITWAVCQYFATWPSDELISYLKTPMLEMRGFDLSSTAFIGFCVKPTPTWSSIICVIGSVLMLSLLSAVGIYWAIQIKNTLEVSSVSIQTRTMQRRMNNLLLAQTACPSLFLYAPTFLQYLMMLIGSTSDSIMEYCCFSLWTMFPIFSPLIIIVFLEEYRSFFFRKFGLKESLILWIKNAVDRTKVSTVHKYLPSNRTF